MSAPEDSASAESGPAKRRVIFTIVSCNYIAFAASLMQSVREFHPEVARYIVLADGFRTFPDLDLAADLLSCNGIGIEFIENMQLWYTVIEFNTAIKPFVFRHFLERENVDQAVYIDPDIQLFRPLREVFAGLDNGHDIVLTPHMMKPLQDGKEPSDLTIMKSGVYNLGFLGVGNTPDGRKLMEWWSDRCFTQCRVDIAGNMFTDQRWMDLSPVFVGNPLILRHPGYNVAYWNLVQRDVRRSEDGVWTVNDQPLTFFHFSGINPENPKVFSKHQNRFTVETLGPAGDLCVAYRSRVLANGWLIYNRIPYAFGTFPNGRRIEDAMRHWLARSVDAGQWDPKGAIAVDSRFFDQADEEAAAKGALLTRLMYQFWLDRKDLRDAFEIASPEGLAGYTEWFIEGDGGSQGVDARSINAARRLLGRPRPQAPGPREMLAPPWPAISREAWPGPASEVGTFLKSDVTASFDVEQIPVPKHLAWLWEQRPDLQQHFAPLDPPNLHKFVAWALTSGVQEGAVDFDLLSEEFLGRLTEKYPISDHYGDVPITALLVMTRSIEGRSSFFHASKRFPVERAGRLAHGLWFAYVAAHQFSWPPGIVATVAEYFDRDSDITIDGFALTTGMLAIWELREDVQRIYPLDSEDSIRGYLLWLLNHGLEETGISLQRIGANFCRFLESDSPSVPGLRWIDEMLYTSQPDLMQAFDATTEDGFRGLHDWFASEFAPAHAQTGLGLLFRSVADETAVMAPEEHTAAVALTGEWSSPSGRGEDVRCSALSLQAMGFNDFLIVDIDKRQVLLPDGTVLAKDSVVKVELNIFHTNAQTAFDDWRRAISMKISAKKSVGFWAWELERLPSFWRCAFAFYDEIWASTRFAEQAFAAERLRPVRLMPMAVVARSPTRNISRQDLNLPEDATVFLFMFDFRSFAHRKNPEAVVQAFLRAFPSPSEKVYLVIKTMGGDERPEDLDRLDELCTDRRISLRDTKLSREEVIALVQTCDAFVSLHRSEGFGRGPAEAMLSGRPTIVTGYSGTADFATEDCAYIVDYTLVPVQISEYPGVENQRWADASVSQAAAHMRRVHERRDDARRIGDRARDQIIRLYSPEVSGAAMLSAVQELISTPDELSENPGLSREIKAPRRLPWIEKAFRRAV